MLNQGMYVLCTFTWSSNGELHIRLGQIHVAQKKMARLLKPKTMAACTEPGWCSEGRALVSNQSIYMSLVHQDGPHTCHAGSWSLDGESSNQGRPSSHHSGGEASAQTSIDVWSTTGTREIDGFSNLAWQNDETPSSDAGGPRSGASSCEQPTRDAGCPHLGASSCERPIRDAGCPHLGASSCERPTSAAKGACRRPPYASVIDELKAPVEHASAKGQHGMTTVHKCWTTHISQVQ